MDLTAGAAVTSKTREKDRYGRWVAVCYDPDGFDIGRTWFTLDGYWRV
jgi:endonuclease YncB( thermonuclease family)